MSLALDNTKFNNVLINAGGDIFALGEKWKVGLKDPNSEDLLLVLDIKDLAVATSGNYERGDHIYNPINGLKPDESVLSCTVIHESPAQADAYATALFAARGRDQERLIKKLEELGTDIIIVYENNQIYISENIDYKNLNKDYKLVNK
ncbi:FAD:protein FMN transferase [Treponema sp. R6D11]